MSIAEVCVPIMSDGVPARTLYKSYPPCGPATDSHQSRVKQMVAVDVPGALSGEHATLLAGKQPGERIDATHPNTADGMGRIRCEGTHRRVDCCEISKDDEG